MAKQTGLGDNLYVDGYNLSGDVGSIQQIRGGPKAGDVTGIDKSAHERLGLVREGAINYSGFFNDANTLPVGAHFVLAPLTLNDVIETYCRGTALGGSAACMVAKQINYDPTRAADGMLTFAVQSLSNGFGLEWGTQLTAGQRTDVAATNGTGVDLGSVSPGAFGGQAYLQVFSFAGTSVTVKIQSSDDNAVGDPYTDVAGWTFTAATGRTTQRLATAAINIKRWLRVVTTGTFSSAVFHVMATRNATAVTF